MKVTKGNSFLLALVTVIALVVFSVLIVPKEDRLEIAKTIVPSSMLGIFGLATAYIGGNVADNAAKGKFYNAALDKSAKELV